MKSVIFYLGFLLQSLTIYITEAEGRRQFLIPLCHFHLLTNIQILFFLLLLLLLLLLFMFSFFLKVFIRSIPSFIQEPQVCDICEVKFEVLRQVLR